MDNCHKLGERWPSEECIVCCLKIDYLKLYVLSAKNFPSPEGHGKGDLTDGGHHCS
jgi:hypothetical protein